MLQKRAIRFSLLALLLASGVAAAFFAWDAERRLRSIETERQTVAAIRERLTAALDGVSAAQQAYVTYGQRDEALFARVSGLLGELSSDATLLRAGVQSEEGGTAFVEFAAALDRVRAADNLAKDSLAADEILTAADTLLSASRDDLAIMEDRLRAVQQAESGRFATARASLMQRSWMAIAGVAALWLVGLTLLTPLPAAAVRPQADVAPAAVQEPVAAAATAAPEPPPVDLAATASLCAEISRLTDAASLADILRRAAAILDARGIVIWMGAGEELFAATAYGYDPAVVSRLRPIGRASENATAAAWRTGDVRIVAADGSSHGAIVAPMAGVTGIVGAMAAEVRHGRETDAATRAVTAIIASQLASVLSAWPAASPADSTTNETVSETAASESDRQAAAS